MQEYESASLSVRELEILSELREKLQQNQNQKVAQPASEHQEIVPLSQQQKVNCSQLEAQLKQEVKLEQLDELVLQVQDLLRLGEKQEVTGQQLARQLDSLREERDEIMNGLYYYQRHQWLSAQIEILSNTQQIQSNEYTNLLTEIQDCYSFFAIHSDFMDSKSMLDLYSELQQNALNVVHKKIVKQQESVPIAVLQFVQENYFAYYLSLIDDFIQKRVQQANQDFKIACSQLNQWDQAILQCFNAYNQILQREQRLCQDYFNKKSEEVAAQLQNSIHEVLRPLIIKESSIEKLCQMAIDLKDKQMMGKKLIADIQERLLYKSELFIRDELDGNQAEEKCVWLLAKLFPIVEQSVFKGITSEAINTCIYSIKSMVKESNFIDAQLFLIMHFQNLSKAIQANFQEINWSFNQQHLDISATKEWLKQIIYLQIPISDILRGQKQLIVTSSQNPFNKLKEETDQAYQTLILRSFHAVSDPLFSFMYRNSTNKEECQKIYSKCKETSQRVFQELRQKLREQDQFIILQLKSQILRSFQQFYSYVDQKCQLQLESLIELEKGLEG